MHSITQREMEILLARLARAIDENGYSYRGLADATRTLVPPERIHHSNLSRILNGRPGRNLYVSQLLAILKILRVPLESFFLGRDALYVQAINRLPAIERESVISDLITRLEQQGGSQHLIDGLSRSQ